jgi:hypothetical protein
VLLAEVTGDAHLDVVAGAQNCTAGGVMGSGAVYVFAGGDDMEGAPTPHATLIDPAAVTFNSLGMAASQGVQIADLTADGELDLLVGARLAEVGGVPTAGALFAFRGGSSLVGTPAPAPLNVAGASPDDQLGSQVLLADLTGDGRLEVLGGASGADVGGVVDAGAIYLWRGALFASSAPKATLAVPGALPNDRLGR